MVLEVDGGHRAIKYSRLSGVRKEIYNEGMELLPDDERAVVDCSYVLQVLTFVFRGSRLPSSTMSAPNLATSLP